MCVLWLCVCVCVQGIEMGSDSEFVDVEGESFEEYQDRTSRKRRISQVKQPAFLRELCSKLTVAGKTGRRRGCGDIRTSRTLVFTPGAAGCVAPKLCVTFAFSRLALIVFRLSPYPDTNGSVKTSLQLKENARLMCLP